MIGDGGLARRRNGAADANRENILVHRTALIVIDTEKCRQHHEIAKRQLMICFVVAILIDFLDKQFAFFDSNSLCISDPFYVVITQFGLEEALRVADAVEA